MQQKTGLLLINLGTPQSAERSAVKRFLNEFLSDPRVIDLPGWLRQILLSFVILPFRGSTSANAYRLIWDTEKGSPLFYHTQALAAKLQALVGERYLVEVGMRYGDLSISVALNKLLKTCDKIIIFPLYPQYASASNGSAIEYCLKFLSKKWNIPGLEIYSSFHRHPAYIEAQAAIIKPQLTELQPEKVLFSYHSLPQRHIQKSNANCRKDCLQGKKCADFKQNVSCYRAQCYQTSDLIAQELGLASEQYRVVFQSRLGRAPWIGPMLSESMTEMRQEGIEKVLVACPSFVADCLETLEEVGMRAQAQWQALGGKVFAITPCLNAHPRWVQAIPKIIGINS